MILSSLSRAAAAVALVAAAPAQELGLDLVAAELSQPTSMAAPPADRGQLLVTEKDGRVRVLRDGALLDEPFLDLVGQVDAFGEAGLLSIALHPAYGTNGRFFLTYVTSELRLRLAEYAVSGDPDRALPGIVQVIYEVGQPGLGNHWGGDLAFLADGSLLMSVGDHTIGATAQDPLDPRGSILRLDPDLPPPHVPADNPFFGQAGVLDELWALGLRNPWRLSFDAATGDLWIGDVGGASREEIDHVAGGARAGMNFGWPCLEGTKCTPQTACDCDDQSLVPPLLEYAHDELHHCVIAGHVYRGAALPEMSGRFVHGDWGSARIWSFRLESDAVVEWREHPLAVEAGALDRINAIEVDSAGELYVLDHGVGGNGGALYRIVAPCGARATCAGTPNSTGRPAELVHAGSTSLARADLRLLARQAVPGQPALFFYGPEAIELPFGNGVRCVGGGDTGLFRFLPPATVDARGSVMHAVDFGAPPAGAGAGELTAGSTWHFQLWYRDPFVPGGSGFDFSSAMALSFCP